MALLASRGASFGRFSTMKTILQRELVAPLECDSGKYEREEREREKVRERREEGERERMPK